MPRLMIGTSPFVGAGQFGSRSHEYYRRFFLNPDNIARLLASAAGRGFAGVQVIAYPPVIEGVAGAARITGSLLWSCVTVGLGDLWKELGDCEVLDPAAVVIHGSYADRNLQGAMEALKAMRRSSPDLLLGIASHRPGVTLPLLADRGKDIDLVLCPVNPNGYLMEPDPRSTLGALAALRQQGVCAVGMKPLAAGAIPPAEALSYAAEHCDAVAVGVVEQSELDELGRCCRAMGWL